MLVFGLMAAVLCIAVAAGLLVYAVRDARTVNQTRRASELALVSDCLANVDRVIDLRDLGPRQDTPDGSFTGLSALGA